MSPPLVTTTLANTPSKTRQLAYLDRKVTPVFLEPKIVDSETCIWYTRVKQHPPLSANTEE